MQIAKTRSRAKAYHLLPFLLVCNPPHKNLNMQIYFGKIRIFKYGNLSCGPRDRKSCKGKII